MSFQPNIPSIRRLILPNPGCALVDLDFERADAHFVAWEADEPELKEIFAKNIDIYTEEVNWARETHGVSVTRQNFKSAVHLSDYAGKPRTLASTLKTTIAIATDWQEHRWFGRFPGIRRWHERIDLQLRMTNEIRNIWGYRRLYFDRTEHILPQALAWLAQSGVAEAINRALHQIRGANLGFNSHPVSLQVHDSLLLNIPLSHCPTIFPTLLELMRVEVPYPSPMVIPASLKWSAKSWGDCKEWRPV